MKRAIKFRAWDRTENRMATVTLMDFSEWWVTCGHIGLGYGERNSFKNEETDRHILMQYTGLKDKNGNEIYEGDTWYGGPGLTYAVVWDDEWASFALRIDDFNHFIPEGTLEDGVVTGNIYENPELSEGKE